MAKPVRWIFAAALAAFALCLGCLFAGVTTGYRVRYGDAWIGTVRSKTVFDDAKASAAKCLTESDAATCLCEPAYEPVLTRANAFTPTAALTTSILENTDDITLASAVLVDGERVAVVPESARFSAYESAALDRYKTGAAGETVTLLSKVEFSAGYYPVSALSDDASLQKAADALRVQTVRTETTETEVAFQKVTQTTAAQTVGYSKVITAGKNGVSRTTVQVTCVNGKETGRKTVQTEVVQAPVDQVTLVGTKVVPKVVPATQVAASGFIWPVQRVARMQISSYFGDGRGHKGIDIAAPANTEIYAVKAGTVVTATFSRSYGNYIVIDHGNGVQTLYAHANRLLVSAGQTVQAGQNIALVGRTGYADGNHLHIEVHINGTAVNPAPYLGLS